MLLNRRGVVSFEQLLLDISEALGFPRWHRARVTRLFTTHAQEVKPLTFQVAFRALFYLPCVILCTEMPNGSYDVSIDQNNQGQIFVKKGSPRGCKLRYNTLHFTSVTADEVLYERGSSEM